MDAVNKLCLLCSVSLWLWVAATEVVHAGIRDHVVQAVELKFNCFFLMPVVDAFPTRLREELEAAYEEDLDEVFDVAAVRAALESRLRSLESELHQVRFLPAALHVERQTQHIVYAIHEPSQLPAVPGV